MIYERLKYDAFLKQAKKDMDMSKSTVNYFALTQDWLNNKSKLEALLGKYAHGNIVPSHADIMSNSIIIGEVLEHYFKK